MYALVTRSQIEEFDDEGRRNLQDIVAPNVATSPGFIAGYWLEADGSGEGLSVVLFEDEGTAQLAAEIAEEYFSSEQAPERVRLKSAEVRRVTAFS
jgi:hypothetical protein